MVVKIYISNKINDFLVLSLKILVNARLASPMG
jgi:hypothetical protein